MKKFHTTRNRAVFLGISWPWWHRARLQFKLNLINIYHVTQSARERWQERCKPGCCHRLPWHTDTTKAGGGLQLTPWPQSEFIETVTPLLGPETINDNNDRVKSMKYRKYGPKAILRRRTPIINIQTSTVACRKYGLISFSLPCVESTIRPAAKAQKIPTNTCALCSLLAEP